MLNYMMKKVVVFYVRCMLSGARKCWFRSKKGSRGGFKGQVEYVALNMALQMVAGFMGSGGTDPSEYVAVNMSLRMAAEFKSGRRPCGPRLAALELFV